MPEELKNCPFCGDKPEKDYYRAYGKDNLRVRCETPSCAGGLHWTPIEWWNRRTPSERERLMERVVEALRVKERKHSYGGTHCDCFHCDLSRTCAIAALREHDERGKD